MSKNHGSDDNFIIPLPIKAAENVPFVRQGRILERCACIVCYTMDIQHFSWYESPSFYAFIQPFVTIISIVIVVVVTIVSLGTATAPTAAGTAGATAALNAAIAEILKMVIIAVALKITLFAIDKFLLFFIISAY